MFPLGVNVPDHDVTFQSLSDLLQESVTPYAVSVQAQECAGVLFSLLWNNANNVSLYQI